MEVMGNTNYTTLLKHAEDDDTRKLLIQIQSDQHEVFDHGKIIKGDEVLKLKLYGYTFHLQRRCACSSLSTLYEIFEENQHQLLPGFDGSAASVVADVGSNEGFYAMKLKQENPGLKVYSFEPNPNALFLLEKNIKENDIKNVNIHKCALSDISEQRSFQIVDEITAIGGFRIFGYRPWLDVDRIKRIMVRSFTLDEMLKDEDHIDILKIDVEGAEYKVLNGAEKTLLKTSNVVVECHSDEIKEKIKDNMTKKGFTLLKDTEEKCGDLYFSI
ncbi:MAG: FkbM family methyltransferase [Candidatus Methanofastidiosia archaeon]